MAKGFGNPLPEVGTVRHRPQIEERSRAGGYADAYETGGRARVGSGSDGAAWQEPSACVAVRHQRHTAQSQVLPEAFIVSKEECLALDDRSAKGTSEYVALKLRNASLVEIISRVQRAVAQKFVGAPVKLIGATGRDDADLRSRALSGLGTISVLHDRKFPNGVHAQQLSARPSRRVVDLGRSREFDIIEEKEVFLRAATRNSKHVTKSRVGGAHAAGALRGVVDDTGIQREQLIVASAVERQVFHLAFSDQAGNVFRGYGNDSGIRSDLHALVHVPNLQGKVQFLARTHNHAYPGPSAYLKPSLGRRNFIPANDERRGVEAPRVIGHEGALRAGLDVCDFDRGSGNASTGRIAYEAPERSLCLCSSR